MSGGAAVCVVGWVEGDPDLTAHPRIEAGDRRNNLTSGALNPSETKFDDQQRKPPPEKSD
jgi:hypothetical protein